MSAPERIWLSKSYDGLAEWWEESNPMNPDAKFGTEYVRADLCDALQMQLEELNEVSAAHVSTLMASEAAAQAEIARLRMLLRTWGDLRGEISAEPKEEA